MKNIFKIHRKSPHRSNETPPSAAATAAAAASPSSLSTSALSSSCASDHRAAPHASPPATPSQPSPSPAAEAARPPPGDRQDYFSSEEEFQVQLALAISASKEEFRNDPDGDHVRAAKLLSLGRHGMDQDREEGIADSLSRRYWDYNVLDYNEKVADGFYDIFLLMTDYSSQRKMPSLVDLQTSIGDLGFEVIIVNRAIDTALVELEQIAQCISLGCPVSETGILVQRISELVMEHMGGPILADYVGIPCKLVKGSHYTGVDDDAVNIIKLGDGREFLVDLMAAPGTLIPADVLSAKDAVMNSYKPILSKNVTPWTANSSGKDLSRAESSFGDFSCGNGTSALNDNKLGDARQEKEILVPSVQSTYTGTSSTPGGSSSSSNMSLISHDQSNQLLCSTSATSSKQKGVIEVPMDGDSSRNAKLSTVPDSQNAVDSRNLFADLNPFQVVGVGKSSAPFKATDIRNSGYQRHRENIVSGPGRPQRPLVWKGQSACNEVSNTKQYNFVEGLVPRKNYDLSASSSQVPSSARNIHSEVSDDNFVRVSGISCSAGVATSDNEMTAISTQTTGCPSFELSTSSTASEKNQHSELDHSFVNARASELLIQSSGEKHRGQDHASGLVLQNNMLCQIKEDGKNFIGKHDQLVAVGTK
ncbi:putative Serine/threonine-protein kinase EDR1 [Cocos nucifera]|nr:putative Serine/threonine-protein kinase EDR1 [Cocos nucifera]